MIPFSKKKKLQKKITYISILLLTIIFFYQGNTQCCLQFQNNLCVQCPSNMHLYRNNCIYNIPNCLSYSNGFDCSECMNGYTLTSNANSYSCELQSQSNSNKGDRLKQPINQIQNGDTNSRLTVAAQDIFDPTSYTTIPEFAIGYQLFKGRPQIQNSQVIKLSRQLNFGKYFYYIRFYNESTKKAYEGVYYTDIQKDLTVTLDFHELQDQLSISMTPGTPTNEQIYARFYGKTINDFQNDQKAFLTETFIRSIRNSQLSNSKLDSVRLATDASFFYYELTFYSPQNKQYYTAVIKQSILDINIIILISQKKIQQKTGNLLPSEYQNDFRFINIKNYLVNSFRQRIQGRQISRVILSPRNGNSLIYIIVYKVSSDSQLYFELNYDVSTHQITLLNSKENGIGNSNGGVAGISTSSPITANLQTSKQGALTQDQWTRDISFQQILQFLEDRYGKTIRSFPIQTVIRALSADQQYIYTIVFNPDNGKNTPLTGNKFSDNYFTVKIDNNGIITIIDSETPDLRLVQINLGNNVGGLLTSESSSRATLTKLQWEKDQKFFNVDKAIRNQFSKSQSAFSNAEVQSVGFTQTSSKPNERIYEVTYRFGINFSQKATFSVIYLLNSNAVQKVDVIGRSAVSPNPPSINLSQPALVSFQNKSDWQKDQGFIAVDKAFQNYFKNTNGFTQFYQGKVRSVSFQEISGIRTYNIEYEAAQSILRIIMTAKYNLQTKQTSNIKEIGRTQIQPPYVPPPPPPLSVSVKFDSKQQWEKDQSYVAVNQALQNYFKNTTGFTQFYQGNAISVSYQQILSIRTFRIQYKSVNSLYRIIMSVQYNIQNGQITNIKEIGRTQIQPPQPVEPISIQFKNKSQWEKDQGFIQCNIVLQAYFKRNQGYSDFINAEASSVSYRQINNLRTYQIQYKKTVFKILMEIVFNTQLKAVDNGKIMQLARSAVSPNPPFIVSPPIKPSLSNGNVPRTKLTLQQYQNDYGFMKVKAYLQSKENLKGFNITSVYFSIQNGVWQYSATYQNDIQLTLYETTFNPDNQNVQIVAVAQSSTQVPIMAQPVLLPLIPPALVSPGQRILLTKQQYQNDAGFKEVKTYIQSKTNLIGYTITSVYFSIVDNLWKYSVTYQNGIELKIYETKFYPDRRTVQIEAFAQSAPASTNPSNATNPAIAPGNIQPPVNISGNQRVTLTKNQYQNDLGFKYVDTYLRTQRNLTQYQIKSVDFQIKTTDNYLWRYYVTYSKTPSLIYMITTFNPANQAVVLLATAQNSVQPPQNLPEKPILIGSVERTEVPLQNLQNDQIYQQVKEKYDNNPPSLYNPQGFTLQKVFYWVRQGIRYYQLQYTNQEKILIVELSYNLSNKQIKFESGVSRNNRISNGLTGSVITTNPDNNFPGSRFLDDAEFKIADAYLRNSNFGIRNYLITSITKSQPINPINPTNEVIYNIQYQLQPGVRPQIANFIVSVLSGKVVVKQSSFSLRDISELTGNLGSTNSPYTGLKPVVITDKDSQNNNGQITTPDNNSNKFKSGSSQYHLLTGQQQIPMNLFSSNYQVQSNYVFQLNNDLFSSSSIERIIYNKISNYWKIFLSTGLYYKLTYRSQQNVYFIEQVVPLTSQTIVQSGSFSSQEKLQIEKIIRLNSKIVDVQGTFYPINNVMYLCYRVLITLENSMKYQASFLSKGNSRSNFILISYRMANIQNIPTFNFENSSYIEYVDAPSNIKKYVEDHVFYFNALLNIVSYQVDSTISSLYRVIFTSSQGQFQIIFDLQKGVTYSIDLINAGFSAPVSLQKQIQDTIFKNGQNLVASYCKLPSNYKIVSVKFRQFGGDNTQYSIIYELPTGTFNAIITYSKTNKKYYFNMFTQKTTSGVGKKQKVPSMFQKSQVIDTSKALMTPQFIQSQNYLMSQYSHHLINPQIRSIYTKKDGQYTIVYQIIYDTITGTFLAVLNYDQQKKLPSIKSLVLIDVGKLSLSIAGCSNLSTDQNSCLKCQDGYHLAQDKFCYKNIQNCDTYSGNLCLSCNNKQNYYLLIANKCTYECGPYCTQNIFPYLNSPYDIKCSKYNSIQDRCQTCISGFRIQKNSGRCVHVV